VTETTSIGRCVVRWCQSWKLGYGGHFSTKSQQYSTTLGELREIRARYRREHSRERSGVPESALTVGQWASAGTCGAERLPSADHARNGAWLQLAALAVSLLAWLPHIALDGDLATAQPKTLRYRIFSAPARLVAHARNRILKIPPGWAWSPDLATAWQRLHALHPA
jgi:hypothetical protein